MMVSSIYVCNVFLRIRNVCTCPHLGRELNGVLANVERESAGARQRCGVPRGRLCRRRCLTRNRCRRIGRQQQQARVLVNPKRTLLLLLLLSSSRRSRPRPRRPRACRRFRDGRECEGATCGRRLTLPLLLRPGSDTQYSPCHVKISCNMTQDMRFTLNAVDDVVKHYASVPMLPMLTPSCHASALKTRG